MASRRFSASSSSIPGPRLSTYRPFLDRATFALALAGLLVVGHLGLQAARGFAGGCGGFDPNALVEAPSGCASALASTYATFLGVSNVAWGLAFYAALAILSFLVVAAPERLPGLKKARGILLTVGFLYALYLSFVLLTGRSGGLCVLCLTSHGITAALYALFVADFNSNPARP